LPGKGPYTHSSRVRFTHTDPAGYVFFPRYFEKFQAAVEDWFNIELGVDYAGIFLDRGVGLPTAHTECNFIKPCRLGEMLNLSLRLTKVGSTSLSVEFFGTVNGEQRLHGQSVLVFIDLKDGTPVLIPNDLREKLEAYQAQY
jgi:4-hydroxybenzoyl-CoA thioesterase